jgi:Holliday junction resolvase RusA-like endonuclease
MPNGFDEKWYEDYQRKRAGQGDGVRLPDIIEFEIPLILKLPNTLSGRHWSAHMAQRTKMKPMLEIALRPFFGCMPMEKASVTITRYSTGSTRPDTDNLFASVKSLIDLLLVRSKKHPHSFGLIIDDHPDRLTPHMLSERCATRKEQRTKVKIERK